MNKIEHKVLQNVELLTNHFTHQSLAERKYNYRKFNILTVSYIHSELKGKQIDKQTDMQLAQNLSKAYWSCEPRFM